MNIGNNQGNRDARGRFTDCGNRNGRRRKEKVDPSLPMSRRRAIARQVDRIIPMTIKCKDPKDDYVVEMSIFEACIYRLGILGAGGNRIAATTLVQLAVSNSVAAQNRADWEEKFGKGGPNPLSQAQADMRALADEQIAALNRKREEFIQSLDKRFGVDDDDDDDDLDPVPESV